ncbi:hypothetical protein DXG03_000202 [Asterophora parasitica]|uniref:Uncharacterized protein n=1 Tax=Asterophora parasitica TaxID=117018 RepID=A0A9P7KFS5_9AGAR|nr:hypothetical protein DXG03_000202 [Asterophora parasitica]
MPSPNTYACNITYLLPLQDVVDIVKESEELMIFNTFKIEPSPYPDLLGDTRIRRTHNPTSNGRHRSLSPQHHPPRHGSPDRGRHEDDEGYNSTASDILPAHLAPHYVPETDLVLGRSRSKVTYLVMKAKHRYALQQQESLLEELRVTKAELKKERDEKEAALDQLLGSMFGYVALDMFATVYVLMLDRSQAEHLMSYMPPPPAMISPSYLPPPPGHMTNGNGR